MQSVTNFVINFIDIILFAYWLIIFLSVILSWIMPPTNALRQFLAFMTDPIIKPIRKLMQPLMAKSSIPLDFSPIIAMMLVYFLRILLSGLFKAIL